MGKTTDNSNSFWRVREMNRTSRTRTSRTSRARTVPSTKITPKPKFKRQGVDFAELNPGDWFLHRDCLCVKMDGIDQEGLDPMDGLCFADLCGTYVLPVTVEIKWTKK